MFRTWCRECCIGRGRMREHRAGGRETAIPATATDYGYLNERDDRQELRFWSASVIVIAALGQPLYQRKVQMSMRLLNSRTTCGFAEVLVRSDTEPAILALEESTSTALKLAGVTVKIEEECPVRLADQRVGRVRCEGCERCCANKCGLSRQALLTGVPRRTSSLSLACETLCCDGEQMQEMSRRQNSL